MGLHAHLLELGRCPPLLLPLHHLPGQPRPRGLPLEPFRPDRLLRRVPLLVLGLGQLQQPEEPLPRHGEGKARLAQDLPPGALADRPEPQDHRDAPGYHLG